ncbi:hypothetical protein ACHAXR_011551 [Thalassiosira sp. AJA248-18]
MSSITNLVPIRVDASSSDGAVRVVDTLLIDTTCLPISHAHPPHDGSSSGLGSLSGGRSNSIFSLSYLIDANARHLTESILADAEVYGAVRSSSKTFMGGRLDLLADSKLCEEIQKQIGSQLGIALSSEKRELMPSGIASPTIPDGAISSSDREQKITSANAGEEESKMDHISSKVVRIKLRLRQENIVVVDEFDYDINCSGMEGCDPFSIANGLVGDLKLPPELAPSIAASIVEQIYGVDVSESLDSFASNGAAIRNVPTALVLDVARQGSSTDFAQMMLPP